MPSGCEKCPKCGQETLQPYPSANRASCLRVADCGYSERREPNLRAQVARLEADLAEAQAAQAAMAAALRAQEEADTYFTAERLEELDKLDSVEREVKAHGEWEVLRAKAEELRRAALSDAGAGWPCGGTCCSKPGAAATANEDSSEWVCDCSCHPVGGWLPPEVREQAAKVIRAVLPGDTMPLTLHPDALIVGELRAALDALEVKPDVV